MNKLIRCVVLYCAVSEIHAAALFKISSLYYCIVREAVDKMNQYKAINTINVSIKNQSIHLECQIKLEITLTVVIGAYAVFNDNKKVPR